MSQNDKNLIRSNRSSRGRGCSRIAGASGDRLKQLTSTLSPISINPVLLYLLLVSAYCQLTLNFLREDHRRERTQLDLLGPSREGRSLCNYQTLLLLILSLMINHLSKFHTGSQHFLSYAPSATS